VRPCGHPRLDDDFDVRGVARLCAPCLIHLYELWIGLTSSDLDLVVDAPNRWFRSPTARDLALARVVGYVDSSPEEARAVAVAALVVATCDDECLDLEAVLARWTRGEPTGLAALDDALAPMRTDVDGLLAAVDRVVEVADA